MIGDKDLQRPNIGEEAHFVDRRDDRIHCLILVRLHDNGRVAHPKRNAAKTVLHDALVDVVHSDDGYNVAVATVAAALHLAVQLETQVVTQLRTEELWLQSDGVF